MRISFGGTYIPEDFVDAEDPEPVVGVSQIFAFPTPISIPENPGDPPPSMVDVSVTVPSFGSGLIKHVKLYLYVVIPNIQYLNVMLVHPAFGPYDPDEGNSAYHAGLSGYHVVSYVYQLDVAGVADLGQSSEQPVCFVWDGSVPSIWDYEQDQHGEFRPADDLSVLSGLSMAGEWRLWVYDGIGPRAGISLEHAELEIFDSNSESLPAVSTPTPDFTLGSTGLTVNLDASATSGGEAPLYYYWEIFNEADVRVDESGFSSTSPTASLTVPSTGNYFVTLTVIGSNAAKKYLIKPITVV